MLSSSMRRSAGVVLRMGPLEGSGCLGASPVEEGLAGW